MSMFTVTTTRTFCSQCKRELHSEEEWSQCRRQHTLEYWWRTDPRMMEMLKGCLEMRRRDR